MLMVLRIRCLKNRAHFRWDFDWLLFTDDRKEWMWRTLPWNHPNPGTKPDFKVIYMEEIDSCKASKTWKNILKRHGIVILLNARLHRAAGSGAQFILTTDKNWSPVTRPTLWILPESLVSLLIVAWKLYRWSVHYKHLFCVPKYSAH